MDWVKYREFLQGLKVKNGTENALDILKFSKDVMERTVRTVGANQQRMKQLIEIQAEIDSITSEVKVKKQLVEKLADYAHKAWSGWMTYLYSKCEDVEIEVPSGDGDTETQEIFAIPYDSAVRWQRQMKTPYAELSEKEKENDRKEACEMIAIFNEHAREKILDLEREADEAEHHQLLYPLVTQVDQINYAIKILKEVIDGN